MAARIANRAGASMVIAAGQAQNPIQKLLDGGLCTWFLPQTDTGSARKRWIGSSLHPKGALVVDAGARNALIVGASLLPAGVTAIDGHFERGDLVLIKDEQGDVLGRGLASYTAKECTKLIGHRSEEMEQLLGYRGRDVLIHRDDLVLDQH